ncbi:MAG: UPF0146 family protein [Halanaeroarchaeum sp.]
MTGQEPPDLAAILAAYDRLVEVGIGRRTDLAARLVRRGVDVCATDVVDRSVPAGVDFRRDDVRDPTMAIYEDADAVYARRLPPELQRPLRGVARAVAADLLFTTLGTDPVLVPADRVTLAEGTVHVVRAEGDSDRGPTRN